MGWKDGHVVSGVTRNASFDSGDSPQSRRTIFISALLVLVFFVVLLARLWYLQLLQGEYFRQLSENNRVRLVDLPPRRGLIFDSQGRLLADNQPTFTMTVVPEDVPDWEVLANHLEKMIGITAEELRKSALGCSRPTSF